MLYTSGKIKCLVLFLSATACGPAKPSSRFKEAINQANDPVYIPGALAQLERRLLMLPDRGLVENIWSGHWWPMSQGGTAATVFDYLSPMAKYDMVAGYGSMANSWEVESSRGFSSVSWAGHCNGLAAAGIMVQEPEHDVVYKRVVFSMNDIKALLTEAWQASGYIIGGRCDYTAVSFDSTGRMQQEQCRDLNPGTLHIAVTNYLGMFKKAVILDVTGTYEVWNYPLVQFEVLSKKRLTKEQAMQMVNQPTTYLYNPWAVDFYYVRTWLKFLNLDPRTYEYLLELDAAGNILGGEWLGNSKQDHPDFIWRPSEPRAENPYLDLKIIDEIHMLSINAKE